MKADSSAEELESTEQNKEQRAESIFEYLRSFLAQAEAGMIVSETHSAMRMLADLLKLQGLREGRSSEEATELLSHGHSAFMFLSPPLDTEIYYLMCQYARRPGIIQLLNKRNYKLSTVCIEPEKAHLLFLTTKDDLKVIERRYQIKDKIGLIERFNKTESTS